MDTREVHYKIPWRASGSYPGHHSSLQKGGGLQFRNHVPLISAPDPRRFDIRASLRDPMEQLQVRVYQQTSAISVYVIADLSASMGYVGTEKKQETLAQFVHCMSYSAYRTGDTFGFVGCGDAGVTPWLSPATLNRATGVALAEQLRTQALSSTTSAGLPEAAEYLGARRSLVFLISDFHISTPLLERTLASLALHDVVPVMLWDRYEYERLPRYGIARVADHETGETRMLLMRPRLRTRIKQAFLDRLDKLEHTFNQYGRPALLLNDGFKPDEVTNYFFA